jgi:hypothetical protein
VLYSAFTGAALQWSGMTYAIFIWSSWNEMEQVTYMLEAFWMMVGAGYYNMHWKDFEYGNILQYYKNKRLSKLLSRDHERA